jgi:hypothetical protein
MTTVLVLAAGEQARWEIGQGIKQFLPIDKETLIGRIQRQAVDRGQYATVITWRSDIMKASKSYYLIHRPDERRWIAETLRTTRWLWEPRVIVLLGDVVYSKQIMDSIFEYGGPVRFWGNTGEIYALSFDSRMFEKIDEALDKAIRHAEFEGGLGKLRKVYQALAGFPFDINNTNHSYFETVLHHDYTQDFDTVQEWHNFVREKLNQKVIDDLP